MNIDIFDSSFQLLTMLISTVVTTFWAIKSRKTENILLMFFCATSLLGMLYLFVFQLIVNISTPVFYISELSWVTAYLFLVLFLEQLITSEERKYWSSWLLVPIVIGVGLIIFFCHWGDFLLNITWIGIIDVASVIALRSLLYQRKNGGWNHKSPFYLFVLCFIAIEYLLWISSCIWVEVSLVNPYYWIDFFVSLGFVVILPIARKAVRG